MIFAKNSLFIYFFIYRVTKDIVTSKVRHFMHEKQQAIKLVQKKKITFHFIKQKKKKTIPKK